MTTHELFRRHAPALGIDNFGTFCKVLELLEAPAKIEHWLPWKNAWQRMPDGPITVGQALCYCAEYDGKLVRCRVVSLDGTVIREWSPR